MIIWKKYLLVLFLGIIISQKAFSLSINLIPNDTSSIVKLKDIDSTLVKHIVPFKFIENYQQTFLDFQFPDYDVLLSRANSSLRIPLANDYRFGFNCFSNYMRFKPSTLLLDTGQSISRLSLLLGTKREQLLFLDHKQNIGKNFTATLNYNSIASEGFLFHQFGKFKSFGLGLNYSNKIYSAISKYSYHKVEAEENGGIVIGQSIKGISKSDYGLLKLNLVNGSTKLKQHLAEIDQVLVLFNRSNNLEDSIYSSKLSLGVNIKYVSFGHSYEGSNDSTFYDNFYINPDSTKDTSSYVEVCNKFFLQYKFESSINKFNFEIDAGLSRSDLSEKNLLKKNEYFYISPFTNVSINWKSYFVNADLQFVKSKSQKDNDKSLVLGLEKIFDSKIFTSLTCFYQLSEISPEVITSSYYSNHFIWDNNFVKEKVNNLKLAVDFFDGHLSFYNNYSIYTNKTYYDLNALPDQLKSKITLNETGAFIDSHFKKINFFTNLSTFISDNKIIQVPDLKLFGRVSFKDYFFKRALLAEFGISGVYTSAFMSNAYMPATGQYYLQNEQSVSGVPIINLFVNLHIGSATIFLKMENVNHKISNAENYILPNYPSPPRTFKFGLSWFLRN